jgi:hypothetical protein
MRGSKTKSSTIPIHLNNAYTHVADQTTLSPVLKGSPMPAPQNFKNHARFHPPFHYVIAPLTLLNLIFAITYTIHHWPEHWALHCWWIVMSIVLFLLAGVSRGSTLKAQDRIIRLEERLRLAALLPPSERDRIDQLTTSQLIALRFASDDELPALARRALDQNLDNKAIKRAIVNWRPDNERI